MANLANDDGEEDCGTKAELIAEVYLKKPVISCSEHMHPSQYRIDGKFRGMYISRSSH